MKIVAIFVIFSLAVVVMIQVLKKNNIIKPTPYESLAILKEAKVIEEDTQFVEHITHTISILKYKNYFLRQDKLLTQDSYSFEGSVENILDTLFVDASLTQLRHKNNLYYFLVKTPKRSFNLICYNQNKKGLYILYPIPFEVMQEDVKEALHFSATSKEMLPSLTFDIKTLFLHHFIRSRR